MKERSPNPQKLAKQIIASGQNSGSTVRPSRRACPPADAHRELDIRIDRDGRWHYQGSPIDRVPMVKLFATVLRRGEDGAYWLVTPVEAGRIQVDDVPFTAVELSVQGEGRAQTLTLRTNLDEIVTVDAAHPLRLERNVETGQSVPYVLVREGLEARLLRPVYYELVEAGEETAACAFGVWSDGMFFELGSVSEAP